MFQVLDRTALAAQQQSNSEHKLSGQYAVATCADMPELFEASVALENDVWDRLSFLDASGAHEAHYDELLKCFPDYRLCMIDLATGELLATGMCVPVKIEDTCMLPEEGWDWVVEQVAEQRGKDANVLAGLTISVPEKYRNSGFASDIIQAMRALAAMKGLSEVLIPVRPNAKCQHPHVSMSEYIAWQDIKGRIFDPWLRNQVANGGAIVGVCERSMVVEKPISFWETWTNTKFNESGLVTLEGALSPIFIDMTRGIGRYVEPNVWVSHRA